MRVLISIVSVLFLASCNVQTDVEAHSSISESTVGSKVYVAAVDGQETKSIAWRSNKKIAENELRAVGFQVVKSRKQADYLAYFGYAVDSGKLVTTNYSIPQYGVTGYSGATTYGSVYGNTYSANTYLNPTYGVTGYSTGSRTDKVYTRSAKLFLVDKKTRETVFESGANSTGSCHSFTPVAPYIIKSMLSNYPSGKVGKVTLPTKDFDC